MHFGLLGKKLGHSYSPAIHNQLGSCPYTLFEKQPQELESFLTDYPWDGLNVTIPYKKDVIPFCSQLTERAKSIGAVNTLVKQKDGRILGHNSDYFGFLSMLQRSGLDVKNKKALVLGSGGASVTVQKVLEEQGAHVVVISRSGENNYQNISLHRDASLIVNTTPVGMYPNAGLSPLSLDIFQKLEGVLDVIYNPARTKLLMDAEKRGLITGNGLWMLVAQAKESAEYFLQKQIPCEKTEEIYEDLRKKALNIILIGMPGCGKSTIGSLLAEKLNREFVDADAEIVKSEGSPIPEMFASKGEDYFRHLESEVLKTLGQKSGLVIATGGGCVTRKENYQALHQNGVIVWLQRDIGSLPTEGRPLSQAGALQTMYDMRKPLYQDFSDCTVCNNADADTAAEQIIKECAL